MATTAITTASETKEWVLACTQFEQCEIESLNQDVSFIESELIPPTDPKETNSMYFLKNIPRDFSGDEISSLWVFIDNKNIIRKRPPSKATHIAGVEEVRSALRTILGLGDMVVGALGSAKAITDISLFNSSFNQNISRKRWVPFENDTEIYYDTNLQHISHNNGKAIIKSGATNGNNSYLMSKRHPRHQSYRGHNTSTLIILPNKDAIGIREIGFRSNYYGAFFKLRDGILYGTIRTTVDGVIQPDEEQEITIPFDVDFETGVTLNVQLQCPSAPNAKFMIRNPLTQVSETVHQMELSTPFFINNSSMPFGIYAENTDGTEVEIQARCVDISTEGGTKGNRVFESATSGSIDLSTLETPMIALKIPNMVDMEMNTRDIVLTRIYASCDTLPGAAIRVYAFRDPILITVDPLDWIIAGEGFQEIALNGVITLPIYAQMKKIIDIDIGANETTMIDNPDANNADFELTHGDYILVTMQSKNNSEGKITMTYSEEI